MEGPGAYVDARWAPISAGVADQERDDGERDEETNSVAYETSRFAWVEVEARNICAGVRKEKIFAVEYNKDVAAQSRCSRLRRRGRAAHLDLAPRRRLDDTPPPSDDDDDDSDDGLRRGRKRKRSPQRYQL
ncbi:hypothetical protein JL722_10848 [Aureococcus anophagefferens]|nr:hypothetical protein JL722_10848 [Aureococcus anophagefferens]